MKRLILYFLALPFIASAQPNASCNPETFTMKWNALSDYQVWGGPRKDRKPIEEKMKPHLGQALDWIKTQSAGITGSKQADHYNYFFHGNPVDKALTNSWYQASGRISYYYTKITSHGLFCRDNMLRTLSGPANIFLYINYANEIIRPMTSLDAKGNSIPLRINGKVIFEVPEIKRSEGRVDYYEYPGPPPPTTVNYGKWEFIHGYIIRNSDKQLLLPFTRKEYLQQYLLEIEKFYKKHQELILQQTNVKSTAEIDKELKDRIEEIKKFTEQGTWGYSKENQEERIRKAEEFFRNKKEEELNKVRNLTQEADDNYNASVNLIKKYLQEQPAEELIKPVPYRLGEKLVNTHYELSFTQRMIDKLDATKEGTFFWGDTKQLCYINKDYFNTTLPPDAPQFIAVEFVNLENNHKHLNAIVANINRGFDFKPLEAILNGSPPKTVTDHPVIVKTGANKFLPKVDSLKDLGFSLDPVNGENGQAVFAYTESPGFNNLKLKVNAPPASPHLSKMPVLGTKAAYADYLRSLERSIVNAMPSGTRQSLERIISKKSILGSEQYSRESIGAWFSKNPAAALYFGIKGLLRNEDDGLSANNFAVHLIKSGYPEKALPILVYWLKTFPKNALLLGTAASANYYMGDIGKAMKLADECIKVDTTHPTAYKILALGNYQKRNRQSCIKNLEGCLKNNFDEEAISLLLELSTGADISQLLYTGRKHGIEPMLLRRFLLPAPISNNAEAERQGITIRETIESINMTIAGIEAKRQRVNMDELVQRNMQQLNANKALPKMQILGQAVVLQSWRQYRKSYAEHYQYLRLKLKDEQRSYSATAAAIAKKYDSQIAKMQTGKGEDSRVAQLEKNKCDELNKVLDNYFKTTAVVINTFSERLELISRSHFTTVAHWMPHWLQSGEAADFQGTQISYLQDMYNILKLYPLMYPQDCGDLPQVEIAVTGKLSKWEDKFCPVKMSMGMGVASAGITCNTISLSGGELFMGEIEIKLDPNWDEITEFTVAGGVGTQWKLGAKGFADLKTGVSAKAFFKFGKNADGSWNYEPIDMGVKTEATVAVTRKDNELELKLAEVAIGLHSGVTTEGMISRLPILSKEPVINSKN